MASLKIDDLQIWNEAGEDTTLFNSPNEAMSFAVSVDLSPDLTADLTYNYQLTIQVIEALTNQVVLDWTSLYQIPENWHGWWFTQGNNWGPVYTTAKSLGLMSRLPPRVFGFRAILQAWRWTPPYGATFADALDVAGLRWFQVSSSDDL
jgi:hypothetical protein